MSAPTKPIASYSNFVVVLIPLCAQPICPAHQAENGKRAPLQGKIHLAEPEETVMKRRIFGLMFHEAMLLSMYLPAAQEADSGGLCPRHTGRVRLHRSRRGAWNADGFPIDANAYIIHSHTT